MANAELLQVYSPTEITSRMVQEEIQVFEETSALLDSLTAEVVCFESQDRLTKIIGNEEEIGQLREAFQRRSKDENSLPCAPVIIYLN